jgi:predicted secreted protein
MTSAPRKAIEVVDMTQSQRREVSGPVDARSGRVVFVSHCLLNENVRYAGGATCPGVVKPVVDRYVRAGVGLCQMPCPEQRAWGGVRRPRMTSLYGARALRWRLVRRPVLFLGTAWTRLVYRRLARTVARDIAEYASAGFEVTEILGVGASPSCGVTTTLDLDQAVAAMARHELASLDALTINRDIVAANVVAGSGMFIAALDRALRRRHLQARYTEHDLIAELSDAGVVAS